MKKRNSIILTATVAPFLPTPCVRIILKALTVLMRLEKITPLTINNLKGMPSPGNYSNILT